MTESHERPFYTALGLIITIGLAWIFFSVVLTQRALGAITESKQSQELNKFLGGVLAVCGDSNHPEQILTITVFGEHQIRYERVIDDFGGKKKENVEEAGCRKNCLCAFKGDDVIQCISMFTQTTGCQDIDIREDAWVGTDPLEFPKKSLFGLPSFTCQFELKLKWDGSNKRVLVEKIRVQDLIYTTGSEFWARNPQVLCAF